MPRRKVQRNTHKKLKTNGTGISKGLTHRIVRISYPIGKTNFPKKTARRLTATRIPTSTHITTRKRVTHRDLAKRTITRTVRESEKAAIRQKRVAPLLSKISPLSCQKKRSVARHSYMSMRAAGKGGSIKSIINPQRFTVRC